MEIKREVALASFSSWLVGGSAEYYCQPENEDQLREAIFWSDSNKQPITVLGGGTNVLISDPGIPGLVIHVNRLNQLEHQVVDERLEITAEAGVAKAKLLKIFLKHKLAPALFLAGLPGDVGGGIVMNAGVSEKVQPREFVEMTDWIEVLTVSKSPELKRFKKSELEWSYRHCEGWQPGVVVRGRFSWPLCETPGLLEQVKETNRRRLHKQPLEMPSCGSVFKNPSEGAAGQIIDECGLRGFSIGGARVSEKHANFIVNSGAATAEEIDRVIQAVQAEVYKQRGIQLTNEVVYLGFWPGRK